jgi:hypothetical protein
MNNLESSTVLYRYSTSDVCVIAYANKVRGPLNASSAEVVSESQPQDLSSAITSPRSQTRQDIKEQ